MILIKVFYKNYVGGMIVEIFFKGLIVFIELVFIIKLNVELVILKVEEEVEEY